MHDLLKILVTGVGATFAVDIWISLLGLFNINSLDYRYVGRWIGNFPKRKFFHKSIMNAEPVKGELIIGWVAHYLIGTGFAFILFMIYGNEWIASPDFLSAVLFGIITAAAPLFIMQPAFGFGIASSKLPGPNIRRLKSLGTHLVYGIGLYLTAMLIRQF
jgi:hypothetical protein